MRVNNALENLACRQASGILEIDGDLPEVAEATAAGPLTHWFGPGPPPASLPRRAQPAPVLPAPPVLAPEARAAAVDGPAPQDLLRRVLEGLRRSN